MISTLEEIQSAVYFLGDKIEAPRSLLLLKSSSTEDGNPHLEIKDDGFEYVCSERGFEIYRKHTTSLDELLFWIISGVAFKLAADYELANRIEGVDSRKLYFAKYISILSNISSEWEDKALDEIGKILTAAPYTDD